MVGSAIVAAALVAAGMLVIVSPASATSHAALFDDLSAGTAVAGQYPGLSFSANPTGAPTVFTPAHTGTSSTPNALHPVPCSDVNCTNRADKIVMSFNPPASSVSLRGGLDDDRAPTEFPTCGRLRAFDSGSNQIADTGDIEIAGAGDYGPITTAFSVADPGGQANITQAVYTSGAELVSCGTGTPRRANIDDIQWEDAVSTTSSSSGGGPTAPPTVTITAPVNSSVFDRAEDAIVSGSVTFSGRLSAFCLHVADGPDTRIPTDCNEGSHVQTDQRFSYVPSGLHGGTNYVNAWIRDNAGRTAVARVVVIIVTEFTGIDTRVDGMEITQSVQTVDIPMGAEGTTVGYRGVELVQGTRAVVRVFADAPVTTGPGRPIRRVQMTLTGFRPPSGGGFSTPLPGSPLLPDNGARDLTPQSNSTIPQARRLDPNGAYVFTLPLSWSTGTITLQAEVNPTSVMPPVPETSARRDNNFFTVTNVEFHSRGVYTISPIMVTWYDNDHSTTWGPMAPSRVFAELRNLVPLADDALRIRPYVAAVDATRVARETASISDDNQRANERNTRTFGRVAEIANTVGYDSFPIGVNNGPGASDLARGYETPVLYAVPFPPFLIFRNVALVNQGRPRTSAAHEFMHSAGFFHAGYVCPTDYPFVEWDPDHEGRLDSVGLDRNRPGSRPGTYTLYSPRDFDIMSYCRVGEYSYWISAHNWDLFGRAIPEFPTTSSVSSGGARGESTPSSSPAAPVVETPPVHSSVSRAPNQVEGAGAPSLTVLLVLDPDGHVVYRHVTPGTAGATSSNDGSAPFRLVVRDGSGAVVSDTGVAPATGHLDGKSGNTGEVISAVVAAPDAASLEVSQQGAIVARVTRSSHAPKVKVLAPGEGQTIGGSRRVKVRWRATDADRDRLVTAIDLSLDGGASWRPLTVGVTGSSVSVPSSLIPASTDARVRVRVSDGWDETAAISGAFRARGTPPQVTILSPTPKTKVMAQGTVVLSGQAFSDAGDWLEGASLTWKDGKGVVGHGNAASLQGLAPGRHRIRLVAKDGTGRTGSASTTVRVVGEKPQLLGLEVPPSIGTSAQTVELRVGATVPAVLKVRGQRFEVDRDVATIAVRVKPGTKVLKLTLVLKSGSQATKTKIEIPRL